MTRDDEYAKAIAEATSAAQLQEISKTFMEDSGLHPHRVRGSNEIIIAPPAAPAPAPVAVHDSREATCYRVVYPSGNLRLELTGVSEEDLDAAETRVRAAFGHR